MSHNTNGKCDAEVDRVPIFRPDEKIQGRLNTLAAHFKKKYDVRPSFFVRVPGRVNLIGEHIDYCGYAVCPMAIEQDILVAVAVSPDNEIRLTNLDSKYKDFQCDFKDVSVCVEDAGGGPDWYKYFLCGVKGALEVIPEKGVPSGILAAVWGNIPPNSGLSSSSALVSAAVLLTVHASQAGLCGVSKGEMHYQSLISLDSITDRHLITRNELRVEISEFERDANFNTLVRISSTLVGGSFQESQFPEVTGARPSRLCEISSGYSHTFLFIENLLRMTSVQHQLSKRELATISANAERYIGTQGGGMDQAIAFLGKAGSAMLIEFNPVRGTIVTLPETAVFVIAHSQACHNKAATTDFNLRVAECRLAAQIIAKKKNKDWEHVQRLIDIQEALDISVDEMVSVVTTDLHEEPYTLNEICKNLDTTIQKLKEISFLGSFSDSQTFKLKQRALHVYQEAGRVVAFRRVCEENALMEAEKLRELGGLMSGSHGSLNKLYECSHPSVDGLVERSMSCGALGARLTGAGWGGCIVAITTKDKVFQFVDALKKELARDEIKDGFKLDDLVFPTEPNQGAAIYTT